MGGTSGRSCPAASGTYRGTKATIDFRTSRYVAAKSTGHVLRRACGNTQFRPLSLLESFCEFLVCTRCALQKSKGLRITPEPLIFMVAGARNHLQANRLSDFRVEIRA